MSSLSLSLLGPLAVSWDKRPLTIFRSNRVPALLAYLAVETDRLHRREVLMELLWPGLPAASARQNLRQTLYLLRQEIPELSAKDGEGTVPLLLSDRHTVQLNPDGDFFLDVIQLEQLVSGQPTADTLVEAIALYRGDFLADFYLPDSENFEEWVAARRAAYRRLVLDGLTKLTAVHLEQANFTEAEKYARWQLEIDSLRESGHRQLMMVLAKNGRRRAALSHYESLSQLLQAELHIEPSAETQALLKAIRAEELRGKSEERREKGKEREGSPSPLAPHASSAPPHNLPAQATPFIGREGELAALAAFIAAQEVRLLTIVGPGGMGKTRLGLAAAEQYLVVEAQNSAAQNFSSLPFPNGVFFVNLVPLREAAQIVPTLADALNFQLQSGQDGRSPQQQLLGYLRQKKLLLLFDNFEHLLDGVDLIADILQTAPEVKVLATSRERLHLRTEQVYPIEGLEFPDWGTPEDAAQYTAVKLFLQSARRNQPDFSLHNKEDLAYLSRICHTVAGMPLALELAASWVDMLPLAEIAAELQQGLDFLETDIRDMPERHHSIRAAIDYSWQKLDKQERDIFAKLSVFRGGFTREAAQAVAGANLRQLARLVNKSLVQGGGRKGDGRYQVHELLRQYGAEKLQESGEETATRERHSHFYCAALHSWETELKSGRQQTAVAQIEADYQNILTAWNEALLQGNLTRLVKAVNGLGEFYDVANRWNEGTAFMQTSAETVQAVFGDTPTTAVQVRLLVWLRAWQVNLNMMLISFFGQWEKQPVLVGHLESNQTLLDQPMLADSDVRAEKAFVEMLLGDIFHKFDMEKSKEHLAVSLHLYQSLDDNFHVAQVMMAQGTYLFLGEDKPEQAYVLLHECLSMFRQIGEPRRIVETLNQLAYVARALLKFSEIAVFADEAYTIAQAALYNQGMHQARNIVAYLAWYQGQFDLALSYQKEALDWAKRTNSPDIISSCLGAVALTQLYRGRVAEALLLYQESKEMSSIFTVMEPFFCLHAGHYEKAESLFRMNVVTRALRFLAWAKLAQANYTEALSIAYEGYYEDLPGNHEHRAWAQIPLAFALYRLGQTSEAKQELYQCLQTCVQIQGFLPLMQLIPITAIVLAESNNERLKERAIELYTLAESLPFVSNSQLFADLAGKPLAEIAASLPSPVVEAAKARGRELDWWSTAESLLTELIELGWGD